MTVASVISTLEMGLQAPFLVYILQNNIAKALEDNIITMRVAEIIATLDPALQGQFLLYIIQNKIERNESEVRKAKKYFLNTTIYTIGYEGKELKDQICWVNARTRYTRASLYASPL